ncbi:MAG: Tetratricopeptide 2 repeat-containing protein [Flavipsychrobacter sp.]|jgi:tetratricopeptide (TPR) repeat protein|nr:Tetratricopeptide 2 repeat-containing protein [Flavipsychrobacter sp.]
MSQIKKYAVFLAVVAFCIYANTLGNDFAYDDGLIRKNELVKEGITAIPDIISSPYYEDSVREVARSSGEQLYRPMPLVLFATEYQLFGDNPMPAHFVNILLYAGCIVLFFFFLYHLFRKKREALAFTAALLFALHPIHTEVVANIKSADELLCFLFAISSLNFFIRYSDTGHVGTLLLGGFLYLLSLFSKETSITFLAIIPLIYFLYRSQDKKRAGYITLLSIAAAGIFLFARHNVLEAHRTYEMAEIHFEVNNLVAAPTYTSRLATAILVLGHYLKLLVLPWPLISDYSYNAVPNTDFTNLWVWLSLSVYVCLFGLGVYLLVKKQNAPLSFGILFFLVTISIFSNIAILLATIMAERFMFFPSAGFCLAAAFFIERYVSTPGTTGLSFSNRKALIVLAPLSVLFAILTIVRNAEWKDDYTLFRADSKRSPNNVRVNYFAGIEEMKRADEPGTEPEVRQQLLHEAIGHLQRSQAIHPDYGDAQFFLFAAFMETRQADSAAFYCRKVLAKHPENAAAYIRFANMCVENAKYADALDILKRVSATDPGNPNYIYNIAVCNVRARQYDSAAYYLQKVLVTNSNNSNALKLIAAVYNAAGQPDSAKKYEAIIKQANPAFSLDKMVLPK